MPVSEYIVVSARKTAQSNMSPEHWDSWWDGKEPLFEYDDIVLDRLICNLTPPGGSIVEAGCGLGRWVEFLRKKGFACTGAENSVGAISTARHLFPKAKFIQCNVTNLEFASDESIDTYLSWGVLEHFREGPQRALAEAFRIVKPGGMLIATIPNHSGYRRIARPFSMLRNVLKAQPFIQRLAGKPESQSIWFEYHYTADEFAAVLGQSGFLPLRVIPVFNTHGIHMASRIFRRSQTVLELNRFGLMVERFVSKYCPSFFAHMNLYVAVKPHAVSACGSHLDMNGVQAELIERNNDSPKCA